MSKEKCILAMARWLTSWAFRISNVRRLKWAEEEQKRKKFNTLPVTRMELSTAEKVISALLFGRKCSQMTGPRVGN